MERGLSVETSILISTYNCELFLLECIGSILRQGYNDYEIIVIDDYSTDNTEVLIASLIKYCSGKLKYFKNPHEKGIVSALNFGILQCRGEFIVRMDADDKMIGNRLEKQIHFLKAHPDIAAIGGNMYVFDENRSFLKNRLIYTTEDECRFFLLFYNTFNHPTMAIRSSVLLENLYDKSFVYCEDYELWVRISAKYKMTNLPDALIDYRIHPNNTQSDVERVKVQCLNVRMIQRQLLDRYEIKYSEWEFFIHTNLFSSSGPTGNNKEICDWINKIFSSEKIRNSFSLEFLDGVYQRFQRLFNKQFEAVSRG